MQIYLVGVVDLADHPARDARHTYAVLSRDSREAMAAVIRRHEGWFGVDLLGTAPSLDAAEPLIVGEPKCLSSEAIGRSIPCMNPSGVPSAG
ncbi:hypothetical protein GCM10007887_40380 [Methylobacterium haplocladii]|uniref:Uncharacterized protein n=2 Tax=Methylobacterium haplocladii TaxID=1176176 RepID=A0A512ITT6_9HYPH|nr:hypothetical protein [Methylobacterium haplocladii]GEP01117.1 hypothetical protein MHA02_35040 [Methylobacterium haplocladii]GLS61333.1 hypothetical protein GCM10007887_40380 [Methylobacterium haplocladii]